MYTADFVEFGKHFKSSCEVASLTTLYQRHRLYAVTREGNCLISTYATKYSALF